MSKVSSIAGPISEYYSRSLPEEFIKQAFMGQLMAKMPYSRGANIAKGVALGGAGIGAGALAYRNRIMNNISKFRDDYNKGYSTAIGDVKDNMDFNTQRADNIRMHSHVLSKDIEEKERALTALKNKYQAARKGIDVNGNPIHYNDAGLQDAYQATSPNSSYELPSASGYLENY